MRANRGFGVVSSLVLAGCGAGAPQDIDDLVGRTAQPILGGSFDTTTPSAVAVGLVAPEVGKDVYGVCTGSLIKINRAADVAYVLTAAHCASGNVKAADVRIGNDWQAPDVILPAAKVTVDEST